MDAMTGMNGWTRRMAVIALFAATAPCHAQTEPVIDPYPGATMLAPGTIATIVQPPAINSRIGPGATPRGIAFPVAGQLLQGTRWRATQSAPATRSPNCSRGWVQVFSIEPGQEVLPGNRDVWICRGDGNVTYAMVSAASDAASAPAPSAPAPAPAQASPAPPASATPQASSPPPVPAGRTADTVPPSTPATIIAGATGPDAITLNWNPSSDTGGSGMSGYRIERCTGAGCIDFREIASTPRPPYTDAKLSQHTTYAYRIRAVDNAGNLSAYSNATLATTQPSQQMLPDLAISDLKVPQTAVVGGAMEATAMVTNKGATAAGAYRVAFYFTDDRNTTFSGTYCDMPALPAGASGPCRGNVAIPGSLVAGTYWIVAWADDLGRVPEKDETNNSGGIRIALTAAPAAVTPTMPVPSGLTANVASGGTVRLAWNAPPRGAPAPAGYKIERCTGSGCTGFVQVATATSNTHTDPGLESGTAYVYRVRAFDAGGNSSNYSNTATAVLRPVATASPERSSQ